LSSELGDVFAVDLRERAEAVAVVSGGVLEPVRGSDGGIEELIVGDLGERRRRNGQQVKEVKEVEEVKERRGAALAGHLDSPRSEVR